MWNAITEKVWLISVERLHLPLFFKPDYLKSLTQTFGLNIKYLGYFSKGEVLALIAILYDSKNNIVLPEHFSYSPFFISDHLKEQSYIEIQLSLIKELKVQFRRIKLKLPSDIIDVRPFTWEGFKIKVKYTHIKSDYSRKYDASVIKNLGKKELEKYRFEICDLNEECLKQNLNFLKELGISKSKINKYEMLLNLWSELNYIKAYCVFSENKLICSNLVLTDINTQRIYTILLNKVDGNYKYAHTFLYHNLIKWCQESNIKYLDFCGANFKSISEFKSRFGTLLTQYFIVSYSPLGAWLKQNFNLRILWKIINV